jgi:hypothetical protein
MGFTLLGGFRQILATIPILILGSGLLAPDSAADPKYKIRDLKLEVSRGKLIIRDRRSGRSLASFPTQKLGAMPLYHWGDTKTVNWWIKEGTLPSESIEYLVEDGRGATGGGLYVTTTGPTETASYGDRLVVIEPERELVLLGSDQLGALQGHLYEVTGDRRFTHFGEVIRLLAGQSGIDGVLNESNGRWISILNKRLKPKTREATLRDFRGLVGGPLDETTAEGLAQSRQFFEWDVLKRYFSPKTHPLLFALLGRKKPTPEELATLKSFAAKDQRIFDPFVQTFPDLAAEVEAARLAVDLDAGNLRHFAAVLSQIPESRHQCVSAALKSMIKETSGK